VGKQEEKASLDIGIIGGCTRLPYRNLFLEQAQEVNALRTLDGHAQSTIPDQLDKRTKGTADTESNSVVKGLLEAVVVEEHTTGSIDVGVGVLSLWGKMSV
jgi:hypothetical protein